MKTIRARLRDAIQRVEIRFWDAFIPLMRKSPAIRYLTPRVYRLIRIKQIPETTKLILILSILGLITGFILGALSYLTYIQEYLFLLISG